MAKARQIGYYISKSLLEKTDEYAKLHGCKRAMIIKQAIVWYCKSGAQIPIVDTDTGQEMITRVLSLNEEYLDMMDSYRGVRSQSYFLRNAVEAYMPLLLSGSPPDSQSISVPRTTSDDSPSANEVPKDSNSDPPEDKPFYSLDEMHITL